MKDIYYQKQLAGTPCIWTTYPVPNTIRPLQNLCTVVHAQFHLLETSLKRIWSHIHSKNSKWAWKDWLNGPSMLAAWSLQDVLVSKMNTIIAHWRQEWHTSRTRIISWTPCPVVRSLRPLNSCMALFLGPPMSLLTRFSPSTWPLVRTPQVNWKLV